MQDDNSPMDVDEEFPCLNGVMYVRVDGYFNFDSNLKVKIPFVSEKEKKEKTKFRYYVEHVENLNKLEVGEARSYYRQITRKPSDFYAILTSRNVVKKVRVKETS
jgi:hypothetical protein